MTDNTSEIGTKTIPHVIRTGIETILPIIAIGTGMIPHTIPEPNTEIRDGTTAAAMRAQILINGGDK